MEYPTVLFGPIFEHQHEDAFITEPPESLYIKNQVKPKPWLTGITKDEGEIFPLSRHNKTLCNFHFCLELFKNFCFFNCSKQLGSDGKPKIPQRTRQICSNSYEYISR